MIRVRKYAGLCDVDLERRDGLNNCGDSLYKLRERDGCHVVCVGFVGYEREQCGND